MIIYSFNGLFTYFQWFVNFELSITDINYDEVQSLGKPHSNPVEKKTASSTEIAGNKAPTAESMFFFEGWTLVVFVLLNLYKIPY